MGIKKFIYFYSLMAAFSLTIGCGEGLKVNDSVAADPSIQSNATAKPVFRHSFAGGMRVWQPANETKVARRLDSDGRLVEIYQDGHEVLLINLDKATVKAIAAKVAMINDLSIYSLVSDGGASMCDNPSVSEVYIGGSYFAVEEQPNCGPRKVLQQNATLDAGAVSLAEVSSVLKGLYQSSVNASYLISR